MSYPPRPTGTGGGGGGSTNITAITYASTDPDSPVLTYTEDGVIKTVAYNGAGNIETITGDDGSVRTLTYNVDDQLISDVTVPG